MIDGSTMTQGSSMTPASSWARGARSNVTATPKREAFHQTAITQGLKNFFDAVTDVVICGIDRVVSPRTVLLTQDERGNFIVRAATALREAIGTPDRDFDQTFGTPPNVKAEVGTLPATVQLAGSRVELMLNASRCLFCPL